MFNEDDVFLEQEVEVMVEREIECDLSSLEIQVNTRFLLNTLNKSQLISAFVPDKVENKDCEVSYTNEWAVVSESLVLYLRLLRH